MEEHKARGRFGQGLGRWAVGLFFWACLSSHPLYARDSGPGSEDDEYSFNWLDTDKKIYVLQNRKYLKGGHPLLSAMAGAGFSNPYRINYSLDGRFTYFMNETWGIEVFYTYTTNIQNSTAQALNIASPNTSASVREIRGQFGGRVLWVPWYAKINVFNAILYFDWYFSAGAGMMQSFVGATVRDPSTFTEDNRTAFYVGTGHLFHLSQSLIFRIDLTGAIYSAPINGTSGDASLYSNYTFGAGLGWKL